MYELFGEAQSLSSWDPISLNATKTEIFSGLKEDVRTNLMAKYELKGDLPCLGPPKINKELLAAFDKRQHVTKRDEFQAKEQLQVSACLNAFGSGMSELLKSLLRRSLDEVTKAAFLKLAEGIHLLSDHRLIKACL